MLRHYTHEHQENDLAFNAIEYLGSPHFWAELEQLRELLQPLHEALKMSESNKTHLGTVVERWKGMYAHLMRMQRDFPVLSDFVQQDGIFSSRYQRQIIPIHIVAYYLTPTNYSLPIPLEFESKIFDFFVRYTDSADQAALIHSEFIQYRNQLSPFEPPRVCWKHASNPRVFWLTQMSYTTLLGKLAVRVFSTPANSVSSERSFSTQNYIHTNTRNALQSDKVDKLIYMYMNERTLRSAASANNPIEYVVHGLSPEEELEIEKKVLLVEGLYDADAIDDDAEDGGVEN